MEGIYWTSAAFVLPIRLRNKLGSLNGAILCNNGVDVNHLTIHKVKPIVGKPAEPFDRLAGELRVNRDKVDIKLVASDLARIRRASLY
jgi:hypothetical protein